MNPQRPLTLPTIAAVLTTSLLIPTILAIALAIAFALPSMLHSAGSMPAALPPAAPVLGVASAGFTSIAPVPADAPVAAHAHEGQRVGPQKIAALIVEGSVSDSATWGYEPRIVEASVGDTITWTNTGVLPHTVTAGDGSFDSDVVAKGATWSFNPKVAGTFPFECTLHKMMKGMLIVHPAPAGAEEGAGASPAVDTPTAQSSGAATIAAPSAPAGAPAPRKVLANILASGYTPATIEANVGDTIIWMNVDAKAHTVTAADASFTSGKVAKGASWSFTATRAGTFAYVCDYHLEMKGVLVVRDNGLNGPSEAAGQPAPGVSGPPADPGSPSSAAPRPSVARGPGSASAQITDTGYSPSVLRVHVGDTVTWSNVGTRRHTVTSSDGTFASDLVGPGGRWSFIPTKVGAFAYSCELHPEMRGTLVVQAGTGVGGAGGGTPQPPPAATPAPQPTTPSTLPPPGSAVTAAQIIDSGFVPSTITIDAGGTVTWTNAGTRRHTVTANDRTFDSGILAVGGRWSHTFTTSGRFSYVCDLHPNMVGAVVVRAATGAPTPTPPAGSPPTPTPTARPVATSTSLKVETALVPASAFPRVSGQVRYDRSGSRVRLEVNVSQNADLRSTTLNVLLGGAKVASLATNDKGEAKLVLEYDLTLSASPPDGYGKVLELRTLGGVPVASARIA